MRRILAVSFLVALTLAAIGCSKSKTTNPVNPAGAAAAALAGDQALANGDFVTADGHYHAALGMDPSNGHANLGAAITGLAILQADPAVDSLLTFIGNTPIPAPAARAATPSRLLARLALSTHMSYDPLSNGGRLARLLLKTAADPIMASWYQGVAKNKLMPKLQYVEDRMATIEDDPAFVYMVPTDISGDVIPREVDLGEVLALDAMVNSLQGVLGMLVAYNFDALPGATDQDLLASTTFGKLNTDGTTQLTAARANLVLAHTRLGAMETFIRAETDDQTDDIIPRTALDQPDFAALKDGYAKMNSALTGTITVDVEAYDLSTQPVDLAAGAFFTTPITDWKSYVPAHTFDGAGKIVITNNINFPHPTFNGIFPTMDNTKWYAIIGPVNPPPVASY